MKSLTFVCVFCVTMQKHKFVTTSQERQRAKQLDPWRLQIIELTNIDIKILTIKMFKMD